MTDRAISFARNAESDPYGKIDDRLDIPVPESVKADASFVARAEGYKTTAEWARALIYRELYGRVNHIQSLVRGIANSDGSNGG